MAPSARFSPSSHLATKHDAIGKETWEAPDTRHCGLITIAAAVPGRYTMTWALDGAETKPVEFEIAAQKPAPKD
jgi:hypothetical protein